MLLLSAILLVFLLGCGTEWCDFYVNRVVRTSIFVNNSSDTLTLSYIVNKTPRNKEIRIDSTFTSSIVLAPTEVGQWTYTYWDSVECFKHITFHENPTGEIDTLVITSTNITDTIQWELNTGNLLFKTDGWNRWEAPNGTIISDTLYYNN